VTQPWSAGEIQGNVLKLACTVALPLFKVTVVELVVRLEIEAVPLTTDQ
jgi:hypothetical protein